MTIIQKVLFKDITLPLVEELFSIHHMFEDSYENSLFKKLLSSSISLQSTEPFQNHTFYLLKDNNNLVGLSMIKSFETETYPLFKLKDSFRSNSKIGAIYDKEFLLKDWFQIYIKPEFRNKGFATTMLHFIENDLIQSYELTENQVPLIVAKGLAYDLVAKKSKYFLALTHDKIYTNKVSDLSHMTQRVLDFVFEPEGNPYFLSHFNHQISLVAKEDKNNALKNKILGRLK